MISVLGVNGYSVNQKNIFEAQIIFMAFMCPVCKGIKKQKVTCKICLKNKMNWQLERVSDWIFYGLFAPFTVSKPT